MRIAADIIGDCATHGEDVPPMEACIEQARLAALEGAIDVAPHGRVRPFGLPTQPARCTAKRHARTFTSGRAPAVVPGAVKQHNETEQHRDQGL